MSLEQLISKSGGDLVFFRAAYMWVFQKDANVWADVLETLKEQLIKIK